MVAISIRIATKLIDLVAISISFVVGRIEIVAKLIEIATISISPAVKLIDIAVKSMRLVMRRIRSALILIRPATEPAHCRPLREAALNTLPSAAF
jgi:S-adenosylmethionine synthetase